MLLFLEHLFTLEKENVLPALEANTKNQENLTCDIMSNTSASHAGHASKERLVIRDFFISVKREFNNLGT